MNEAQQQEHDPTMWIIQERYTEAIKLLEKLKKKSMKYGSNLIDYQVGEPKEVTRHIEAGEYMNKTLVEIKTKAYPFLITGEAPKVGDHELVGRITFERIEEQPEKIYLDAVPNKIFEKRFRTTDKSCEHCGKVRKRNNMYVVEMDGKQLQVGKSCLRDYLGADNPTTLIRKFNFLKSAIDQFEGFGNSNKVPEGHSLEEAVTMSCCVIRNFGFMSSSKYNDLEEKQQARAEKTSTIVDDGMGLAEWLLVGSSAAAVAYRARMQELRDLVTEEDRIKAAQVINYIRTIPEQDIRKSDYLYNLTNLFSTDMFHRRRLGMLVSSVSCYDKSQEDFKEKTKEQELYSGSKYLGNLRERMKGVTGKIVDVKIISTDIDYGEKSLVKIITHEGNVIVWFTYSHTYNLILDADITFNATPSNHNEWRGIKTTVVKRLQITKQGEVNE